MAAAPNPNPIARRRMDGDVVALIQGRHDVRIVHKHRIVNVVLNGPPGTAYADGVWEVYVNVPTEYPYEGPSLGFLNKIFHPNIDENNGVVCMDVIDKAWRPMFDLTNIIELFLPQLLADPNPHDPLNHEAATLFMNDRTAYDAKVAEYIQLYATKDILDQKMKALRDEARGGVPSPQEVDSDSLSPFSDITETDVDEPPGKL